MARKRKPVTLPAEGGFALIEVVVSAMLIVIAGGAVLALISATTRSAAQQRARTQQYALAQEDQSRLRSMRISSLSGLEEPPRSVTLNGSQFEVESSAAFVNNSSGTPSCEENNSSPDYVRITSTVKQKSGKGSAVTLQSIVSPSSGSLDPNHGSLVIASTNGQGTGLSNVVLTGSGPSGFSGKTDSNGCAIFADLPAGSYTVTPSGFGLVDVNGETPSGKEVQVNGNQTQRLVVQLDQPGGLRVPFIYKLGSVTYQTVPAYVAVYNSDLGTTAKGYEPTSETVGTTKYAVLSSLFPFKTAYTLYAGPCEGDRPPAGSEAMTTAVVVAGKTETAPQIRMPVLEITVTSGTTKIKGARVTISDDDCSSAGKYVYTTESNGHQSETTTGPMTPALPWSTYDICASANISGTNRRLYSNNVPVETLASTVVKTLNLSGTGSESNRTCP